MFKKNPVIALLLVNLAFLNCTQDSSKADLVNNDQQTKEEELKKYYKEEIVPVFSDYDSIIPKTITFQEQKDFIIAKRNPKEIVVSKKLVKDERKFLKTFLISRALSSFILEEEGRKIALQDIPEGEKFTIEQKKVLLSDLISFHFIRKGLLYTSDFLTDNLFIIDDFFAEIGYPLFPDKNRLDTIKEYTALASEKSYEYAYEKMFAKIWNEGLSNNDAFKKLYTDFGKYLFADFGFDPKLVPDQYFIEDVKGIEAGAAPGYISISKGLINYENRYVQAFALAHEIGHIYTISQAKKMGLGSVIPSEGTISDYKKAEYIADLFSIHVIDKELPFFRNLLIENFEEIENILGEKDFFHPSGKDRVISMKKYLNSARETTEDMAFEKLFKEIWNL